MRINAKTILLSLLVLVVLLVLAGITAVGWQVVLGPDKRAVTDKKFDVTDARLARGKYLTEGPMHCFLCHSDHDITNPEYPIIQSTKGAGWTMPIPELNNISSKNLTPDPETGLGNWTDDEIARAIREGVRKDGTALFPLMPYMDFATLDDEDLASIVVYLRTLAPVKHEVPKRNLPGPLEYLVKTMPKPITTPQPSHPSATPEDRGKYLVRLSGCAECHSLSDDRGQKVKGLEYGGGGKFDDPIQKKAVFTANITQDPSGIAHYDEAMFIQTLHTGQVAGRMLNHVMPFESYRNITDADLADMFAFLKTVPPVKHRISNTDPPTMCAVCKQSHGLGELNSK